MRRLRVMVTVAVVVFVLAVLAGATVAASDKMASVALPAEETPPTEVPALVSVLELLAGGIGMGAVLAFLFEKVAWFQKLRGETKGVIVLCVNVGLPVLAVVLLQFVPASVWGFLEPYWQAIARGFLAWGASQVIYKAFIKKRSWEIQEDLVKEDSGEEDSGEE